MSFWKPCKETTGLFRFKSVFDFNSDTFHLNLIEVQGLYLIDDVTLVLPFASDVWIQRMNYNYKFHFTLFQRMKYDYKFHCTLYVISNPDLILLSSRTIYSYNLIKIKSIVNNHCYYKLHKVVWDSIYVGNSD